MDMKQWEDIEIFQMSNCTDPRLLPIRYLVLAHACLLNQNAKYSIIAPTILRILHGEVYWFEEKTEYDQSLQINCVSIPYEFIRINFESTIYNL